MKSPQNSIIARSNESLRAMYRHRNITQPMEGNRTPLTIGICVLLLCCLVYALFHLELQAMQQSSIDLHVGTLTRHVMALFVILLFLLIDGSPETLALGLFLGCEAVATSISNHWIKVPYDLAVQHSIAQLGDLLRLYFACQIARLTPKYLSPWIIWGLLLSIPYGLAMQFIPEFRDEISIFVRSMRELAIGLGGAWLCARVGLAITKDHVPWRVVALFVAAFSFLEAPSHLMWDTMHGAKASEGFGIAIAMYHSLSYYGFALAAFINISTIENRIRALSSAKAEERLEKMREEQRVHEAIAKTTQMLAHDVRKPFSLLKAYTDSISAAVTPDEARTILARMIPEVQKSLKTVDQLISDVMDIGRDLKPQIRPLVVQSLLSTCIEQVFRVSKNPNISFRYYFRHHGKILGDEQQLTRVFSNILENAEQAIAGRGECITISTFNDAGSGGERISIEIHNSGSFVPKADIKNIFDAFFTKGKKSGTGLGLAIVKKIIRQHGGKVGAASDQQSGTSFRFLLPAQFNSSQEDVRLPRFSKDVMLHLHMDHTANEFSPNAKVNRPIDISLTSDQSVFHAVLVDDEIAYAEGISAIIRPLLSTSATIYIASSANDALTHICAYKPNLIICDFDLHSNDFDGIDILKEARALWPNSYNVLHTNHLFDANDLEQAESAIDKRLAKPLNTNDLQAILTKLSATNPGIQKEIAIIEDDLIFAEHLERQLSEYKIHVFTSPAEFAAANDELLAKLSVIITDMYFEGADQTGTDLATLVKKRTEIPVLLYSNRSPTPDETTVFSGFIRKDSDNARELVRFAAGAKK